MRTSENSLMMGRWSFLGMQSTGEIFFILDLRPTSTIFRRAGCTACGLSLIFVGRIVTIRTGYDVRQLMTPIGRVLSISITLFLFRRCTLRYDYFQWWNLRCRTGIRTFRTIIFTVGFGQHWRRCFRIRRGTDGRIRWFWTARHRSCTWTLSIRSVRGRVLIILTGYRIRTLLSRFRTL